MERIRAYLQSRLHLIPRYRQRLAYIPYQRHPVWIDDARFNIFYHVRHAALPPPGSERRLKRLLGRILSQKLDRTKPLWEIWFIEGLEDGRVAMVAKAHHAMVDGISGLGLLTALLSPVPDAAFVPGPAWAPRERPSATSLVADEAWRRGSALVGTARLAVQTALRPWSAIGPFVDTMRGMADVVGATARAASVTPLNPPIGPHRRYDWVRFDLDQVKAVKRALGGTVNDVVLATVAGAVRRFLLKRCVLPDGLDFRVLVPVSLHAADEGGAVGNRVANMIARLPVGGADIEARYYGVLDHMQTLKGSAQVRGGELLFSYSGGLYWGLNADWDTLPDLRDFTAALTQEFDALRAVAHRRTAAA